MDEYYDRTRAASRLDQIIRERPFSEQYLAAAKMEADTVHRFEQPRAWRLCSGGSDTPLEEACFRIQGILCGKDIPPILISGARASRLRSRKYIRQNVKLTGFGNDDMLQCIKKVEETYLKMLNHFKEGDLDPWQPSVFDGMAALEANTRYFTAASHAEAADIVDFAPHVDADGQLKALMDGTYVHTTDNRVEYMLQETSPDGTRCYRDVDPVTFKLGDIVEATISFAVMQTKSKTAKMHVLLRALVLIDHAERDAATILKMRQKYRNFDFGTGPKVQPSLKRKTCYYNRSLEEEEASRSMHRMRIDSVDTD